MKKYKNKKLLLIIGGIVFLILSLTLYLFNDTKKIEDDIVLNIVTEKITTKKLEKERFYVDVKGSVKKTGVYEITNKETIQNVINKAGGLKKDSYTDNINLSKLVKDEMVIYIHSNKEINNIKKLNNCNCSPIFKFKECKESEDINHTESTIKTTESLKTITTTYTTTNKTTTIPTTTITVPTTKLIRTTKPTSTTMPIIEDKEITTNILITTTNINKKININNCTIEELISIKGLGEIKAKNIIEYRNVNGPFKNIEDILNVNGIGNKTFENIKEYIEI